MGAGAPPSAPQGRYKVPAGTVSHRNLIKVSGALLLPEIEVFPERLSNRFRKGATPRLQFSSPASKFFWRVAILESRGVGLQTLDRSKKRGGSVWAADRILPGGHAMLALRTTCGVAGRLLLRECSRRPGLAVQRRSSSGLPMNTLVLFVPQQEAWVVERMGRFHRILEPGLNFVIPLLDRIRYVQSLKEIVINVPEQSAITHDNVTLQIDGVLYLRIIDPYKASYGVEDPEYAVTQLAQTTMRSELGKLSLDKVFRERESLNASIVHAINQASDYWGILCLRYEIKDIHVPPRVKESMQMQVEAERRKRATVLESEGTRESAINVAEGKKQAQILASEAEKAERINQASGEASAILVKAQAKAEAIQLVSTALAQQNGSLAASLSVAEQYVQAFSQLAKESNTILLPSNTGDVGSMVAQAMAICSSLGKPQGETTASSPLPVQSPPSTESSDLEQSSASYQ